jgi:hypothetical protein
MHVAPRTGMVAVQVLLSVGAGRRACPIRSERSQLGTLSGGFPSASLPARVR